jgi:hypothetical protein
VKGTVPSFWMNRYRFRLFPRLVEIKSLVVQFRVTSDDKREVAGSSPVSGEIRYSSVGRALTLL